MAGSKISALSELTTPDPANDFLVIVDASDPTMAASGTDKKIKPQNLGTAGGNSFSTMAVGAQNVVADSTTDTLTWIAGTNITLTADAVNDTITVASAAGGGSGLTTVGPQTANYTAAANQAVLTNTTAGAFTVTLPAAPANGTRVQVIDTNNKWPTNNLTIGRGAATILGVAANFVLTTGTIAEFIYNSSATDWEVWVNNSGLSSVKTFGAVGNGVTDDAAAFNAASATPGNVWIPPGTYKLNSDWTLNPGCNVLGAGEGLVTLDFSTATLNNGCVVSLGTTPAALPALSVALALNASTVTFASAHGLAVNQSFILSTNTADSYLSGGDGSWRRGEICEVRKVTSTTVVELKRAVRDSYTTTEAVLYAFSVTGSARNIISSLSIKGNAAAFGAGLRLQNAVAPRINSVHIYNSRYAAGYITNCVGARLLQCRFSKEADDAGDGVSYGLVVGGSQDLRADQCDFYGDRHAVAIGGGNSPCFIINRGVVINGCVLDSNIQLSADWHPICEDCTYSNCRILNGVSIAGDKNNVINCEISRRSSGPGLYHIAGWYQKGWSFLFQGNKFLCQDNPDGGSAYIVLGNASDAKTVRSGTMIFKDNVFVYPDFPTHIGTTQAGGSTTTIMLATAASATNSFYNGFPIRIHSGTNAGYLGYITAYTGASRLATLSVAAPASFNDTSTTYEIIQGAVGGRQLFQLTQAGPSRPNLVIEGLYQSSWAPSTSSGQYQISMAVSSQRWGEVTIRNANLTSGIELQAHKSVTIENVNINGAGANPGLSILDTYDSCILRNLSILWTTDRAAIIYGTPGNRIYCQNLVFSHNAQNGNPVFQVNNAGVVFLNAIVINKRAGGNDLTFNAGTAITEIEFSGDCKFDRAATSFLAATQFYTRGPGGSRITWGTARPTTGTWAVGDRAIRTNVASGGTPGSYCTTAGTPGTWRDEAVLTSS